MAFLYPEDRARVEALMSEILAGEQRRYDMEFRIVRSDGQVRWVMDRGQATATLGTFPNVALLQNLLRTAPPRTLSVGLPIEWGVEPQHPSASY
jgi:hypothetical protein